MEDCEFVSCKATGTEAHLVSGKASEIVQCIFSNCAASSHLLDIHSESNAFQLRDVSFVGIVMVNSFIYIRNLNFDHLSMTNCVLADIEGGTILEYESTTFQIDIDNLTVTGSQFTNLTSMPGAANVQNCNFTSNTITGYLFQPTNKLVLSVCHFNNNTGLLVQSTEGGDVEVNNCDFVNMKDIPEPMITSSKGSVSISGATFDNCWCANNPLLLFTSLSLLSVNNCCFQGAAPHQGSASYLACSSTSFAFELPLCFDLNASESVDFGDSDPLQDITSKHRIFECDTCAGSGTESSSDAGVSPDRGLGPGAIAGIAVAIVAVIAGVIVLVVLLLRRRYKEETGTDTSEMVMETADVTTTYTGASVSTADDWSSKISEDTPAFTSHLTDAAFDNIFEEAFA